MKLFNLFKQVLTTLNYSVNWSCDSGVNLIIPSVYINITDALKSIKPEHLHPFWSKTQIQCSPPENHQEIALVFSRRRKQGCCSADCRELGSEKGSIDWVWLLNRCVELIPLLL